MVQQCLPTKLLSRIVASRGNVRVILLALATAIVGTTAGCTEPVPFKHNAVAVLPMGSFASSWFVDMKLMDDRIARLDCRDKYLYVYLASKRVVAFDRKAGTLQLSMQVKSPDTALMPLVELKDRIVFPNATSLEIFDSKGAFNKSIKLFRPLRSDCAGEGDNIYFGSVGVNGGLVESYNVERPLAPFDWEFMTHDHENVTAGICEYGGVIYSGSEGGEVDAVTTSRMPIWDTPHYAFLAHGRISADLKADEFGLYIASEDSNLYCVNRNTGKLKWQYFAGVPLYDSPVTTADTVYEYVPGSGLAALDKLTGAFNRSPRWIHPTATKFLAQDDRYAYLADPRPNPEDPDRRAYAIIAVDKHTMKQAFESSRKDFSVLGTNRRDSLIYGAFEDGKLFAIKPVVKAGQIGELVMDEISAERRVQNAE